MEVKGDIELTKRSLQDLKKDVIKTKKQIGNVSDKALAKIINSRAWSYVKVQPMVYNKERKQEMKNLMRMVELMKTFPQAQPNHKATKEVVIPITYIEDILKKLKNVDSTL